MLVIKNATDATGLYLIGQKADGTNKFYLGTDVSDSVVNLHNYIKSTTISLSDVISASKTVRITGQVQPSDWTNIDSRYIPAGTLSNLAKLSDMNIFRSTQVILQDDLSLQLRNTVQNNALYFAGYNADNVRRWYIGNGEIENPSKLIIHNDKAGTTIFMQDDFYLNKTVKINGQVQPSDWANLDARFLKVSGSTAANLIIDSTNHGVMTGKLISITTRDGWNRPQGFTAMTIAPDSSVIPDFPADAIAYLHVFAKRDTAGGQLAFLANYSTKGIWLARSLSSTDKVTFEKIYTDGTKPTPSELGAYTKSETDQKIAQAISDSTDLNKIYPVGIVTWFNSNVNPNTALPGLTWTYLNNGVGRTIRIAAANGSDVATTGGSDSVTLAVGNLPSHTHSFSATTSSFDYGVKETVVNGAHSHAVSGSTNSAGYHAHQISQGDNANVPNGRVASSNSRQTHVGWTEGDGAHTHSVSGSTDYGAQHAHAVAIGAHTHTVSGDTGGTGSGSAFSVTNQFYKLMAWVRTA